MTSFEDEFLAHYGTKGMRWGVRKNLQNLSTGQERLDYLVKKDAKWTAKVEANPKLAKMARISARDSKKQIKELKKQYKEAGYNVKKNGLHQTRYDNEVSAILQHSIERASHKVHGRSGSGLLQVTVHRHPDGSVSAQIGLRQNQKLEKQSRQILKSDEKRRKKNASLAQSDLMHEDPIELEDFDGLQFLLITDDEGFVDDVRVAFDDVEHDDMSDEVDDFLEHYGVMGMRWGVRKRSSGGSSSSSTSAPSSRPKWQSAPPTKVHTLPPAPKKLSRRQARKARKQKVYSEDAAKFIAIKAKAKEQGVQALTNDELRTVTNRMNLQVSYAKAFPKKKNPLVDLAIEGFLSEWAGTRMVDFVGGPAPRTLSRTKKAEAIGTALMVGRQARKYTQKQKKSSKPKVEDDD